MANSISLFFGVSTGTSTADSATPESLWNYRTLPAGRVDLGGWKQFHCGYLIQPRSASASPAHQPQLVALWYSRIPKLSARYVNDGVSFFTYPTAEEPHTGVIGRQYSMRSADGLYVRSPHLHLTLRPSGIPPYRAPDLPSSGAQYPNLGPHIRCIQTGIQNIHAGLGGR
jgi:hypothetical protein